MLHVKPLSPPPSAAKFEKQQSHVFFQTLGSVVDLDPEPVGSVPVPYITVLSLLDTDPDQCLIYGSEYGFSNFKTDQNLTFSEILLYAFFNFIELLANISFSFEGVSSLIGNYL